MSLAARTGWLRLLAEPLPDRASNLWGAANVLLQLPAPEFSVTTRIDFGNLGPKAEGRSGRYGDELLILRA